MSRRTLLKLTGASAAAGMVLAACGPVPGQSTQGDGADDAPPAETSTLVFSSYTWSGYEESMNQIIELWKAANPGVEVETMYAGWDDYWTKLTTLIAAGTPPDVGIGDYGRLVTYAKSDVLYPLDEMISQRQLRSGPIDSGLCRSISLERRGFRQRQQRRTIVRPAQ